MRQKKSLNKQNRDVSTTFDCEKFAIYLLQEIDMNGFEEIHKKQLIVTFFLGAVYKISSSDTGQKALFEEQFKQNLQLGLSMGGLSAQFFKILPKETLLQYEAKEIYKFFLDRAKLFTLPEYIALTIVSLKILWKPWKIDTFFKQPGRIGATLFAACFRLKIEADSYFLN